MHARIPESTRFMPRQWFPLFNAFKGRSALPPAFPRFTRGIREPSENFNSHTDTAAEKQPMSRRRMRFRVGFEIKILSRAQESRHGVITRRLTRLAFCLSTRQTPDKETWKCAVLNVQWVDSSYVRYLWREYCTSINPDSIFGTQVCALDCTLCHSRGAAASRCCTCSAFAFRVSIIYS